MKTKNLPGEGNWIVYILRCCDNTLYTGITNNIERRLLSHNKGRAAKYTRSRLPVALLAFSRGMAKEEALRLEIKIKKQHKEKKLKVLSEAATKDDTLQ